jgi:hypothetical protein
MESTTQTTEPVTLVEEKEVFSDYAKVEKFTKPYMYREPGAPEAKPGEPDAHAYLRSNMFMGHRICDILPWLQDFRIELISYCTEKVLPFVTGEVVDAIHCVGDGSSKGANKKSARFGEVSLIQLAEAFQHHQLNGVPLGLIWAKRLIVWLLLRCPFPFLENGQTVRYCNHKRVLGLSKPVFKELEDRIRDDFNIYFPGQKCEFQIVHHTHIKGDVERNEHARNFTITVRPGFSGETLMDNRKHHASHKKMKHASKPRASGGTGAKGAGSA